MGHSISTRGLAFLIHLIAVTAAAPPSPSHLHPRRRSCLLLGRRVIRSQLSALISSASSPPSRSSASSPLSRSSVVCLKLSSEGRRPHLEVGKTLSYANGRFDDGKA